MATYVQKLQQHINRVDRRALITDYIDGGYGLDAVAVRMMGGRRVVIASLDPDQQRASWYLTRWAKQSDELSGKKPQRELRMRGTLAAVTTAIAELLDDTKKGA